MKWADLHVRVVNCNLSPPRSWPGWHQDPGLTGWGGATVVPWRRGELVAVVVVNVFLKEISLKIKSYKKLLFLDIEALFEPLEGKICLCFVKEH